MDHLSLYQLTVEDGTAFGARHAAGSLRGLPDDDLGADLYELTQEMCDAAGMPGYEVSNPARPGSESRHNLIYWRAGDYVGIGPGAHGRLTLDGQRFATDTPKGPTVWLTQVEKTGSGDRDASALPLADQAAEYLMMSLRLAEGSDLDRFVALGGSVKPFVIKDLAGLGLVEHQADRLRATAAGRIVLNGVLRELLAG